MFDYGEMLYKLTRYEDAIRVYEDALSRVADEDARWAIYNQLGHLYQYWGRPADAEPWFRKAIEADPEVTTSYIFLGACQARQGKLKEAEETHRAATLCKEGLKEEAYMNLGLVLRAQGRFWDAVDCFERAIELYPQYSSAIEALEDVKMAIAIQGEV